MRVERQMIGKQIDVVREQCRQSRAARAGHARLFTAPEITVMHQDRVGRVVARRNQQIERRRDACHNRTNLRAPFHLQPVWAIIAETAHLERLV